jgi:hypothetical protein
VSHVSTWLVLGQDKWIWTVQRGTDERNDVFVPKIFQRRYFGRKVSRRSSEHIRFQDFDDNGHLAALA